MGSGRRVVAVGPGPAAVRQRSGAIHAREVSHDGAHPDRARHPARLRPGPVRARARSSWRPTSCRSPPCRPWRPAIADAVAHESAGINRYPDNGAQALVAALAEHTGAPRSHIVAGCGSVALCQQLVQATADDGDEVLFGWRSFEAYPIVTQITGATAVRVPVTAGHELDLPAIAAAITPATRLIFICTPNNPTGTAVRPRDLVEFLDAVPDDVLVVDRRGLPRVRHGPGVARRARVRAEPARTCSPCAPCPRRTGWPGSGSATRSATRHVITALRKVAIPFALNSLAQAAALAALAPRTSSRRAGSR